MADSSTDLGSPVAGTDDPLRVVVVCLGNICRSPMAAAVLRSQIKAAGLSDAVVVTSAGTAHWHVGKPADDRARAALLQRGYDDAHVARQFRREDADEADLILAMDLSNLEDLRSMLGAHPTPIELFRTFDPRVSRDAPPPGWGVSEQPEVPDPYYGGQDGFDTTLDLIEVASAGVVAHLSTLVDDRKR